MSSISVSARSSRRSLLPMMLVAMVIGLLALVLINTVYTSIAPTYTRVASVPTWLRGKQAQIPPGLTIVEHTEKHGAAQLNAWKMYSMLLQGECVASVRFCGGSDIEFLYICLDPVTDVIAGLIRTDNLIKSAFGYNDSDYWEKRVEKENWIECNDYD